jgi:SAM-dependent methyltransferase
MSSAGVLPAEADIPPGRAGPPASGELARHQAAWRSKGLLRRVYRGWYRLILEQLSGVDGETIELGSGIGRIKEVIPAAVTTDLERSPWTDLAVDAGRLPFGEATVANLVLLDVFHHLARPAEFLAEATRVLAPGGRVVMLEPYCSPVSTWAYRRFHHESLDLDVTWSEAHQALDVSPWTSNIALPTLAFFRRAEGFERRFPGLAVRERRRLTLFVYALSGGYSARRLAPAFLYGPLMAVERLLSPLLGLAAFRCLVVLERH